MSSHPAWHAARPRLLCLCPDHYDPARDRLKVWSRLDARDMKHDHELRCNVPGCRKALRHWSSLEHCIYLNTQDPTLWTRHTIRTPRTARHAARPRLLCLCPDHYDPARDRLKVWARLNMRNVKHDHELRCNVPGCRKALHHWSPPEHCIYLNTQDPTLWTRHAIRTMDTWGLGDS
jgi:hypothetical protein